MPSAGDKACECMRKWFGDISDYGPCKFLLARGWTETAGVWKKPTLSHNPSPYEVDCLLFLRDEWDHDFERPLFPESSAGY